MLTPIHRVDEGLEGVLSADVIGVAAQQGRRRTSGKDQSISTQLGPDVGARPLYEGQGDGHSYRSLLICTYVSRWRSTLVNVDREL
jgi:hypothetical protein